MKMIIAIVVHLFLGIGVAIGGTKYLLGSNDKEKKSD